MPSTPTHINLSTLIERPDSGKIDSGNQRRLTKLYTSTRSVVEAALKIKGTANHAASATAARRVFIGFPSLDHLTDWTRAKRRRFQEKCPGTETFHLAAG